MIEQLQDDNSELAKVRGDEVVAELCKVAFANIGDVISWDADSGIVFVKSSDQLDLATLSAIANVKTTTQRWTDNEGQEHSNIKLEVRLYDKLSALDKLAKIKALYDEAVTLKAGGGIAELLEAVNGATHGKLPSHTLN